MHFRRLLLNGFIISAALCFPSFALADKIDHAPAPNNHKALSVISAVKTNGNQNGNGQHKGKGHLPIEVTKYENPHQKPFSKATKNVGKSLTKPIAQKFEHGKKRMKVTNPGLKKGMFKNKNKTSNNQSEQIESSKRDVPEKYLPIGKPNEGRNVTLSKTHHSISVKNGKTVKKRKDSLTKRKLVFKRIDPEKSKSVPSSNRNLPRDIPIITTTSLGGSNSTDTSKDRSNLGTSSINITGWFEWGKNKLPSLSRSFISRSHELSNQWTNAPPIQPPKSLLF